MSTPFTPDEAIQKRHYYREKQLNETIDEVNNNLKTSMPKPDGSFNFSIQHSHLRNDIIERYSKVGWIVTPDKDSSHWLTFRFPQTPHSEGPYR